MVHQIRSYYDNGIKFFDRLGAKLDDELELEIEEKLEETMVSVDSDQLGRASRLEDASGRYIEFCKHFDGPISFSSYL